MAKSDKVVPERPYPSASGATPPAGKQVRLEGDRPAVVKSNNPDKARPVPGVAKQLTERPVAGGPVDRGPSGGKNDTAPIMVRKGAFKYSGQ